MKPEEPQRDVRYGRRLVFALLFLVLFDPLAPWLLRRVETGRYEAATEFRFENSDLFALGPLVSYLRENPRSLPRRVVFFGNSVVFGYGLPASDAVPAQFQVLQRGVRAFNMAVNGSELGSSYLIAKAMIDSVDTIFVQVVGAKANPMLPSLIPVDEPDVRAFRLTAPDPIERRLRSLVGIWSLYGLRYRFQAAFFGTSTRQYLYLHKKAIARRFIAPLFVPARTPGPSWPAGSETVLLRSPRPAIRPTDQRCLELRKEQELLWRFADLAKSHHRRVVFMQIDGTENADIEGRIADFNAIFEPFAEMIIVTIPRGLKYDSQHMMPRGAAALASVLALHEKQLSESR